MYIDKNVIKKFAHLELLCFVIFLRIPLYFQISSTYITTRHFLENTYTGADKSLA